MSEPTREQIADWVRKFDLTAADVVDELLAELADVKAERDKLRRSEQWIRQYALPALEQGRQLSYRLDIEALAHLPEGVRLAATKEGT